MAGASFFAADIDAEDRLAEAFGGCEAVAHLAGINRETGRQTYQRVHVQAFSDFRRMDYVQVLTARVAGVQAASVGVGP